MIIVSNTTPLNYLVLLRVHPKTPQSHRLKTGATWVSGRTLKKEEVLPALFGNVIIPPAVASELKRAEAPEAVRTWITKAPPWLLVQAPRVIDLSIDLHMGERQAIALAEELHADRILLDETKARRIASSRGLRVAGTLAVLFEAHERGLLDFRQVVQELRGTTFFMNERLIEVILDRLPRL